MKAFCVTFGLTARDGFSEAGLKTAISQNLAELNLKLLSFSIDVSHCKCICIVEYPNYQIPLYHQTVLGCFLSLSYEEYPYFDMGTIAPSIIENQNSANKKELTDFQNQLALFLWTIQSMLPNVVLRIRKPA